MQPPQEKHADQDIITSQVIKYNHNIMVKGHLHDCKAAYSEIIIDSEKFLSR